MVKYKTINLEQGRPTVDEARKRLIREIDRARQEGVVLLKIIHGYGSSGSGGVLGVALRRSLRHRRKEGKVETFVSGENFSVFDDGAQALLDRFPQLRKDSDLNRENFGVTIVILKK